MRVLHIIGSGTIGGAERHVLQLARRQSAMEEYELVRIFFVTPLGELYDLASNEGLVENEAFSASLRHIARKYDIIHVHGLYLRAFFTLSFMKIPIIFTIHGRRSETKPVRTVFTRMAAGDHRLQVGRSIRRLVRRKAFVIFLNHRVQRIIAPTEYYRQLYITKYGVKKGAIDVVHWGVPIPAASSDTDGTDNRHEQMIGVVTTFRPVKRVDRAVRLFSEYRRRYGGAAQLMIVGDGQLRGQIESMVNDLDLTKFVRFIGRVTDVTPYYDRMTVMLMPSEMESFSITILEASMHGVPTLVYAGSGGAQELAEMTGNFVIEEQGENNGVDLLHRLLQDDTFRREAGIRVAETARTGFSEERMVKHITSQYLRELRKPRTLSSHGRRSE